MSDTKGGFPDLSGILARVSENPQAMSMLSSLLGGMSESPPSAEEKRESEKREEAKDVPAFMPSKPHSGGKAHEERRRLLLALKPFLSRERRQALETLLVVLDAISLLPLGKEPPCT